MKKIFLLCVITILCGQLFSQTPPYVPTTGLIGWYPFTGNPNDFSGNNLNGTIIGGVTLSTDRFGNLNQSYTFDGTSGYINVPNNTLLTLSNQYTISGWFYPTSLTPGQQSTIISQSMNTTQGGLCLNLDHLQSYNLLCDNTDNNGVHQITSDSIPSFNIWYHSVVTYDGTTLKIYLNALLSNL